MKSKLLVLMETVAGLHPNPQDNAVILSTLKAGASLALLRVRELGGTYAGSSDVTSVEWELYGRDATPAVDAAPPSAPTIPDDSPL